MTLNLENLILLGLLVVVIIVLLNIIAIYFYKKSEHGDLKSSDKALRFENERLCAEKEKLISEASRSAVKISDLGKDNSKLSAENESKASRMGELHDEIVCLKKEGGSLNNRINELEKENSKLRAEKSALEAKSNELVESNEKLIVSECGLKASFAAVDKEKASCLIRIQQLTERIDEQQIYLSKVEEKFKIEFQNISNEFLSKYASQFKTSSKESLEVLIAPLLKDITSLNQALIDESKSKASLEGSIHQIFKSNREIADQSEKLTNALKGNSKIQGDWGEVLLEKILEESGLRKGFDYVSQGQDLKLRSPDNEEKTVKPDFIVNLPEDKHIIIDSKISLKEYEAYFSEDGPDKKLTHLENFKKSIINHIDQLSSKRYQDVEKLNSPEFVVMFLGVEGSYSLAIQNIPSLHNYAWNRKVVLVNPSTLFATLRTIASVWRLELQNQNADKIADSAGKLYDKFVSLVDDMLEVKRKIETLSETQNNALNKLTNGRGNLIKRANDLKSLGIKTNKKFPSSLAPESDDANVAGEE